jgi:F-type H+-transporting ATPase subunit delta
VIAPNVSRRYAKALLEIGLETSSIDALVRELDAVAQAYVASDELRSALENPLFALTAKKAIVADLAERLSLGPVSRNTAMMLCDRRRLRILPEIAQLLREMNDLRAGVVRAEVTTAIAMSDAYYEKLRAQLEKMTGRKVVIDKKTDPAIIAGVVTRIGDRIFDGSVRSRLESLKSALTPN